MSRMMLLSNLSPERATEFKYSFHPASYDPFLLLNASRGGISDAASHSV